LPDPAEIVNEEATERVTIVIDDESDKENGNSIQNNSRSPAPVPECSTATTPAPRLAWKDLIGMPDNQKEEDEVSPSERLLWHNERDAIASTISPMLPRRGKKRARSSSPTSSPAYSKPNTPAVNVEKLRQALMSPHADPALDLWDRFSVGAAEDSAPLGSSNPLLARLMGSSSPRPSKNTPAVQGESNLRRAISCGANWPKRRRADRSEADSPTAAPRGNTTVGSYKSSMVTALLETVTGEINKADEADTPYSLVRSPSPQKRRSPRKQSGSHSDHSIEDTAAGDNEADGDTLLGDIGSSDYGDDDFDDDTLMELDSNLKPVPLEETSPASQPVAVHDVSKREPHNTVVEDEFGDLDDDDIFAAAEDLIAEIDSNPTSQHVLQQPLLTKSGPGFGVGPDPGTEDGEDPYGDDFGGDFDFEAAELAATQSVTQPGPLSSHVRTYR